MDTNIATVGLTGGIASGKSATAKILAELGVEVVDADQIAREVVRPGEPTLQAIVASFGDGILSADGTLDRKHMAAHVFSDEAARQRLNQMIHPAIAARSIEWLEEARQKAARTGVPYVVYEAPLLIENSIHRGMDGVIVVDVGRDTQVTRLRERDGLSQQEALARLAAQMPVDEKRRYATWLVDNRGDLRQLRAEVQRVHEAICRQFGA